MAVIAVIAFDVHTTSKGFKFKRVFRANSVATAQGDLVVRKDDLGAVIVEDRAATEAMFSAFFSETLVQVSRTEDS